MDHTDPAASRLEALEVKVAFMDDLLDHLNALVARQQAQIDRLTAEVRRLAEQQPEPGGARSLRDELPPHW
jgi:SlyX protein